MILRKTLAVTVALLAVGFGATACRHGSGATGGPAVPGSAVAELRSIQTTLDAIDAEVAGDDNG